MTKHGNPAIGNLQSAILPNRQSAQGLRISYDPPRLMLKNLDKLPQAYTYWECAAFRHAGRLLLAGSAQNTTPLFESETETDPRALAGRGGQREAFTLVLPTMRSIFSTIILPQDSNCLAWSAPFHQKAATHLVLGVDLRISSFRGSWGSRTARSRAFEMHPISGLWMDSCLGMPREAGRPPLGEASGAMPAPCALARHNGRKTLGSSAAKS